MRTTRLKSAVKFLPGCVSPAKARGRGQSPAGADQGAAAHRTTAAAILCTGLGLQPHRHLPGPRGPAGEQVTLAVFSSARFSALETLSADCRPT